MKRHAITLLIAVVVIPFCAASAQQALYKFKPNTPYKYSLELKQEQVQEAMGQTMNVSVDGTVKVSMVVDKVLENGDMHASVTIENALILAETAQGSETTGGELKGKVFGFTMQPNGKVVDRDSIPDMGEQTGEMAQVMGGFTGLFPKLDIEKLKTGSTWEKLSDDTAGTGDTQIITNRKMSYNVKATKPVKKRDCLEIVMDGTKETNGKVSRGDQDYRLSGEGTVNGTIYFDLAEGLLVEISITDKGDTVVQDPNSSSFKLNISQNTTTKLEYLPE
ncbi:MAG: hypothetical protein IPP94_10470 [Ignavibacteria bacterium]|nr:hypothetical protein [Ignavibacteria bacterium]